MESLFDKKVQNSQKDTEIKYPEGVRLLVKNSFMIFTRIFNY